MTNAITWTAGPPPEHMRDGRDVLVKTIHDKIIVVCNPRDGLWYRDGNPFLDPVTITHHAAINWPDETT